MTLFSIETDSLEMRSVFSLDRKLYIGGWVLLGKIKQETRRGLIHETNR